jgi:hypothetical protein
MIDVLFILVSIVFIIANYRWILSIQNWQRKQDELILKILDRQIQLIEMQISKEEIESEKC